MTSKTLLFAASMLLAAAIAAPASSASEPTQTSIDQFVDCTDGFWAIACGVDLDRTVTVYTGGFPFDEYCVILPATGDDPYDSDYLPPRGECFECTTRISWVGLTRLPDVRECTPYPGP